MLKLTSTETEVDSGDTTVIKTYECDFVAECDGTSIWSDTNGQKVHVTGITVIERKYEEDEDEVYVDVLVAHDSNWEIYTDKGFERAISAAVGFDVYFTEQGMQDNNCASMEA